jgi:hypothetical protein
MAISEYNIFLVLKALLSIVSWPQGKVLAILQPKVVGSRVSIIDGGGAI